MSPFSSRPEQLLRFGHRVATRVCGWHRVPWRISGTLARGEQRGDTLSINADAASGERGRHFVRCKARTVDATDVAQVLANEHVHFRERLPSRGFRRQVEIAR